MGLRFRDVILNGMKGKWIETGDKKYFDFIKKGIDTFVQDDGSIKTYKVEDYNIDQVNMGRAVLLLYRVTGEAKYKKAADLIRSQLERSSAHKRRRFLAQENLSVSDVARRALYGRTVLCRILGNF